MRQSAASSSSKICRVALRLLGRRERVHPRELAASVTGIISDAAFSFIVQEPERDHRRIEPDVLPLEAPDVAHHLAFRNDAC